MKSSTKKFYHKGVNKQKRADIIFEVTRVDEKVIKNWSLEQKLSARSFFADAENSFIHFKRELLKLL